MAVKVEKYEPNELPVSDGISGIFNGLKRRLDGRWVFFFRVEGEALLPDGRRVRISRHLGLQATEQIGRKPAI